LKRDPHCDHLFVFRGRRRYLIKCLWSDGRACRLEQGRFLWPSTVDGAATISVALANAVENLASDPQAWLADVLARIADTSQTNWCPELFLKKAA
jgi:transposase